VARIVTSATKLVSLAMIKPAPTGIPQYFYSVKQRLQILLLHIRTEYSSLNNDLFRKNITESHSCGEIDHARHYFLHCLQYIDIRQSLLLKISEYSLPFFEVILKGNALLDTEILS